MKIEICLRFEIKKSFCVAKGGKRWRPVLLLLTAEALGKKPADVIDLVAICEIVHNGIFKKNSKFKIFVKKKN